jgi:hypothetical protein
VPATGSGALKLFFLGFAAHPGIGSDLFEESAG